MTSALPTPADSAQHIFLTGGSTAIGRDLAHRLVAAGHRVTATCDSSTTATHFRAAGITPAYPDLRRAGELRSAMPGVTLVINLHPQAANLPPQLAAKFDLALAEETTALSEATAASGAAFLLHTSYAFLNGHAHGEDAEDDLEPAAPLLEAARAAERAALAGSVPGCVLRLGYLYGPDMTELKTLAATLKAGRFVPVGETHARAAWLHQTDAVNAVLAALTARPAGVTLTAADTEPATPADFVRYFATAQGLTPGGIALPFISKNTPAAHKALMLLDQATAPVNTDFAWTPRFANYQQGIDDLLLSWRAAAQVKTGATA